MSAGTPVEVFAYLPLDDDGEQFAFVNPAHVVMVTDAATPDQRRRGDGAARVAFVDGSSIIVQQDAADVVQSLEALLRRMAEAARA